VKNNQMMQVAGQSLAKKTEALIKEYHRQSNIQQTIDALSQAFPGTIKSILSNTGFFYRWS
jgi:hypothetical protein